MAGKEQNEREWDVGNGIDAKREIYAQIEQRDK